MFISGLITGHTASTTGEYLRYKYRLLSSLRPAQVQTRECLWHEYWKKGTGNIVFELLIPMIV